MLLVDLHVSVYGARTRSQAPDEVLSHAGFNVETVEYKNISFTVWDVGGQDKVCTQLARTSANKLVLLLYHSDLWRPCRFGRFGGITSRIRRV